MRRYNPKSMALALLCGLFGWAGFVAYRLVRPYTGAQEAAERLTWCVKARRNGGYWTDQGERKRLYRQGGRGGPLIAQYKRGCRWVGAL
jgi:hypothetical protein